MLVLLQARLSEFEGLVGDQRRDGDARPLLGRDIASGLAAAVALTAGADRARGLRALAGGLRLAERCLSVVGGVAQHRPHRRAIPHVLAGAGQNAIRRQRSGDVRDRLATLGVAVEDLTHDLRLALVDLVEGVHMLGLPDIPVAIGSAGHHRVRTAASAVRLPAAGALTDLRPLVLGDHSLELAQQLVLGRAAPLGLLREADLHAHARELLQQQHLVGVTAREPVGRVAEQNLERSLRRAVAQPLQRRALQARPREPLVLEHEVLGDEQPALRGELTQPDGLACDRLVLALTLRGHSRVDRRHPAHPVRRLPLRDHTAHRPSVRCLSHGAARAPRSRTPARGARWRAGHPQTRSQRALPRCRSRA